MPAIQFNSCNCCGPFTEEHRNAQRRHDPAIRPRACIWRRWHQYVKGLYTILVHHCIINKTCGIYASVYQFRNSWGECELWTWVYMIYSYRIACVLALIREEMLLLGMPWMNHLETNMLNELIQVPKCLIITLTNGVLHWFMEVSTIATWADI